jgi:hypothetical protein
MRHNCNKVFCCYVTTCIRHLRFRIPENFSAKGIKRKKRKEHGCSNLLSYLSDWEVQRTASLCYCFLPVIFSAVRRPGPPWIFALLVRMDAIVRITCDSFSRGREPELLAKLNYPLSAACSRLANSISDGAAHPRAGPGMSGCQDTGCLLLTRSSHVDVL